MINATSEQFTSIIILSELTESCAKDCGNQCCSKVQIDKVKKKYKKSLTVAKIVENPSRRLSAGKQKMEIQINLGKMFLQFSVISTLNI